MRLLMMLLFILTTKAAVAADLAAKEEAFVPGLPTIGKWMIDSKGEISHWLGYIYKSQKMLEPINIIIEVTADSPEAAQLKFIAAAKKAGFENRKGHSSGYSAMIGDAQMTQFPAVEKFAFSDEAYLFDNNHGRFFGPLSFGNKFYIIGALSREDAQKTKKTLSIVERKYQPLHVFDSFNVARDRFALQMMRFSGARSLGIVALGNSVQNDTYTTGDHDGNALLLELQ